MWKDLLAYRMFQTVAKNNVDKCSESLLNIVFEAEEHISDVHSQGIARYFLLGLIGWGSAHSQII